MLTIVPIVEGDGELQAFLLLLRRLLGEQNRYDLTVARPHNAHGRTNLLRPGGIEGFLRSVGVLQPAGIIVLLDLDEDDCGADVAHDLAGRARQVGLSTSIVIVVAVSAYEAWFLASIETTRGEPIKGQPFLRDDVEAPPDPEAVASPKRWLGERLIGSRGYKETLDQAPLTEQLDLGMVRQRSRSFRRLNHAVTQLIEAIDDRAVVTP